MEILRGERRREINGRNWYAVDITFGGNVWIFDVVIFERFAGGLVRGCVE